MVVAQYLLTFREVLEAALLTAIILAFLVKTNRASQTRYAWFGIYGALGASVGLGLGIWLAYGTLGDAQQTLFEGVAALVAVAVLTSMIYWMATKGRTIRQEVEGRVEAAVTQGTILALFSLTFVLVVREGLETVLFLTPFLVQDPVATMAGAGLGLAFGVLLAYGVFRVGLRLDIRKFFYLTSVLLVLLAGGLLGYGVHELIEYGEAVGVDLGWWASAAYQLPFASGDLLHHKGAVGSIFAVMFGYTVSPEWARIVAHVVYLAVVLPVVIAVYRRPEWIAALGARLRRPFASAARARAPEPEK